jgi:hypothetical protein
MYVCMCVRKKAGMCVFCMYVYMNMYMCIYTHMFACISVCVNNYVGPTLPHRAVEPVRREGFVYVFVCMHVCVYMYVWV